MNFSTHQPNPVLAILIPCYNEEEAIGNTIDRLLDILNNLVSKEIISSKSYLYIIDDGSNDGTWGQISLFKSTHPVQIHGLKFSRNFGHQNALFAGLMSVENNCDITISIDADLQQDPNAMENFIHAYKLGSEIVFGIRNSRDSDSFFKKYSASSFYKLMNLFGVNVIPNHADYRLISNKVINSLARFSEPNLFLRAICSDLGFKTANVYFDVSPRLIGSSKYSLIKMISLAIQGIFSMSIAPLRMVALLGIFIFTISLIMSIYVLIQTLFIGNTVPGWASTVLPIYLIGGLQILCLGIMGEYMGRIYATTKQRPKYIIEDSF
jgi:glycosyltransferase involved in cell wall biosynthesis